MKTTIKKLKSIIKEAVGVDPFWEKVEATNELVGWDEAKQHMPPEVVKSFESKVIEDQELDPDGFEFSYAPITYNNDRYRDNGDDYDGPASPDGEGDDGDNDSYYQAYSEDADELWHCNAAGEWMLYNY